MFFTLMLPENVFKKTLFTISIPLFVSEGWSDQTILTFIKFRGVTYGLYDICIFIIIGVVVIKYIAIGDMTMAIVISIIIVIIIIATH